MILELYKNFQKKSNSTKIPTRQQMFKAVDVKLKRSTSLDNPVFLLSGVEMDVNYVHLTNGRYYFVNDIVLGNENIYELHCSTDYLGTYRNAIFGSNFYVERSASDYNNMFADPLVSVQTNVVSRDYKMWDTGFDTANGSYIVRIAGGDSDGISTFVVDSLTDLGAIFNKSNYFQVTDDSFTKLVGNFIFDPFDYVVGLYWCPISLSTIKSRVQNSGQETTIKVKWYDTGISAWKLYNNKTCRFSVSGSMPHNIYSDFRKHDPRFSQYSLYIPAVGNVPISYDNAENLLVEYFINLDTGATRVTLINLSGNTFFASYNTNIYKSIEYGEAQGDISSIVSGVVTATGGFASGNIPMGVASTISVAQNIVVPTPSIAGANSGLGLQGANKVIISVDNYGSGAIDLQNNGRPLYERRSLATLSGFTKCGNASIDIVGLAGDKERVNSYLNSGFFIE